MSTRSSIFFGSDDMDLCTVHIYREMLDGQLYLSVCLGDSSSKRDSNSGTQTSRHGSLSQLKEETRKPKRQQDQEAKEDES